MDSFTQHLIMAGIRRAFLIHPYRLRALENAKKYGNKYTCNDCYHQFERSQVTTDHIEQVGSFSSWDEFIERVFVTPDKLQVLCIRCHKKKTKKEMKKLRDKKKRKFYLETRTIFQEIRDEQEELEKQPSIIE